MNKSGFLAAALAFATMGEAQINGDFSIPSSTRGNGYTYKLQLTPKQRKRRKLNKIGRKSRKYNFKHS